MLDASCAMARALRLRFLARTTGAIMREADRRGLLGDRLIVLGVAAMAAYAGEAGRIFRNLSFETGTPALAWIGNDLRDGLQTVRDLLTAVDPTFTVDPDLPTRSRNAKGYEVDILYIASS